MNPELRRDPITGRWVIVAEERGRRPNALGPPGPDRGPGACPFCEGHEGDTTPEIYAIRPEGSPPNGDGWQLRVIPNKFPAVRLGIPPEPDAPADPFFRRRSGHGAHEVIIESPRHVRSLTDLGRAGILRTVESYRARLLALREDESLSHALIFKNVGEAAGASLFHTHSQLVATSIVPLAIRNEMAAAEEYWRDRGSCVFCEMIERERAIGERLVWENDRFVAFCPFASRLSYETWILPKVHASHFESIDGPGLEGLAEALGEVLGCIEAGLNQPDYNYIIHSAPFIHADSPGFHWHIEVLPRVTKTAGYEWGTGFFINAIPPETAAATLRRAPSGPA